MNDFSPEAYRILAIDDSLSLLNGVKAALEQAGFQALTASSGEEALELMKSVGLPHLALVDINMPPGMDGFELCQALQEFCDLPVIMLTAVGEEDTIVQAIEQFAEDYITKPFELSELIARVRRVLRRMGDFNAPLNPAEPVDRYMKVSFAECQVTVDSQRVSLTPTENKLLYILMRSAGRTLTTNYILRRLWPMETPNEGRLRVYVHRLRQKIEITQPIHQYITAERGVGYGFVASENIRSGSADNL
jgi:DNA-binding response OmpR family regulator